VRKIVVSAVGVGLAAAGVAFIPSALAQPSVSTAAGIDPAIGAVNFSDDLPNPLGDKRRELRETAVQGVINGRLSPTTRNGSTVVKVGHSEHGHGGNKKDQYVELAREKTDRIFVILAEFGDTRHPSYPDVDTDPGTAGPITWDGPQINQIPEPDRTMDNSTVWRSDFNADYFRELYFGGAESLRDYYETQSSGRYSVDGTVTDWVRVQYNEARYGRSNGFPCGSSVCSNTWRLVEDAANQWVADQVAAGRSMADITAELQSFDVWDRYDYDGDGDFNESDGYIDHFQIVHAGGDQADGDPIYGEDAIWSHRWYTFLNLVGSAGPPGNLLGGNQIGATGVWVGDYTIQPENGGRSVFYHEYAHDLGLPDDYNILSGGDNNNEHWTLMAQSRLGAKHDGGIGERGGDLGAWNKLQLGWLNYATVNYNQHKTIELGPQEYNSAKKQAAVVVLPQKEVVTELGDPFAGVKQWHSGTGDDLNNTLSRQVTLPAGSASLTFQARWDIEDCGPDACDYAFVEVDDGSGFTPIAGSITNGAEGDGIDGASAGWTAATFDLSAYASQTIGLRFRYFTDGAVAGNDGSLPDGLFIDDIAIAATGFSDGAESLDPGWTMDGFSIVESSVTQMFDQFYIAGHRSFVSFDKYLKTGPYYFGYLNTKPDFVDHYSYQQGLLISYWDTSYSDNDTFAHPGSGRNMYIDAHPQTMYRSDAVAWRARVQVYDAPFGLSKTDKVKIHHNSVLETINSQNGQSLFDDTKTYWYATLPNHGVILPAVGVKIRVLSVSGTSMKIRVN
jgi:immune inhibitor A